MSGHEYVHPWQQVASVTEAKARLGEPRRYKVGNRRMAYRRHERELIVVRVGHWLVRPEEARSDAARARSAELNRKRWERGS